MTTPKNTAAGFRNLYMGFVDDDGVLIGSSPTAPSPGTGSGMLRLWAAKRAPATVPSPDVVIAEGDDGEVLTEYSFRSIASRGFIAEVAAQDLDTAGALANLPVRTIGRGQMVGLDRNDAPVYNVCCILQGRSTNITGGGKGWSGVVVLRATATYIGRAEFNERNPAVYRFFVTPLPTGWTPAGYTLLDNNGGQVVQTYDEFRGYPNPITMHAFTGNGVLAAVPVNNSPVSVAASYAANTPPSGQGATNAPITSVTTSSPFAITLTTAPAQAVRTVILYEYSQ